MLLADEPEEQPIWKSCVISVCSFKKIFLSWTMFSFSEEKSDKQKKAQQEQAQMEPHVNGCSVLCEINKGEAPEESSLCKFSNPSLTRLVTDGML